MNSIYLSLNRTEFEKQKANARKTDEELTGDDSKAYTWEDLNFNIDDWSITDGELYMSGDIKELGYVSFSIELSLDMAIELISHYMKQVNKMKTVLEAIK